MTNKTIRISSSKVIIEPFIERRNQKAYEWKTKLNGMIIILSGNRRNTEHNYENPPHLFNVFIPLEFQPKGKGKIEWKPCSFTQSSRRGVVGGDVYIFTPDDGGQQKEYTAILEGGQIVIEEEWLDKDSMNCISIFSEYPDFQEKIKSDFKEPPSTMPASLNTFTVVNVLGCEESWTQTKDFENGYPKQKWHFNYLMKKEVKK